MQPETIAKDCTHPRGPYWRYWYWFKWYRSYCLYSRPWFNCLGGWRNGYKTISTILDIELLPESSWGSYSCSGLEEEVLSAISCLLVSGGHTKLLNARTWRLSNIRETIDDAWGFPDCVESYLILNILRSKTKLASGDQEDLTFQGLIKKKILALALKDLRLRFYALNDLKEDYLDVAASSKKL